MSEGPVWQCQIEPFPEGVTDLAQWTVGGKVVLSCEGSAAAEAADAAAPPGALAPGTVTLEAPVRIEFPTPEQEYSLVILDAPTLQAGKASFIATAYKAGEHKFESFFLVDKNQQKVEVRGLSAQVQSVLKVEEQQEAYPYFGPIALSFPWWLWLSAALIILLFVFVIVRQVKRISARKRLIESLSRFQTAQSPYNVFYKELRQIQRKIHPQMPDEELLRCLKDQEHSLRMVLVREFKIPALDWGLSDILKELKRSDAKVYKELSKDLRQIFKEFNRASHAAKPTQRDSEQLQEMTRKWVDEAFRLRKEKK